MTVENIVGKNPNLNNPSLKGVSIFAKDLMPFSPNKYFML